MDLRGKTEVIYGLMDENSKDSYSVWDKTNRTFIRTGQIPDKDGRMMDVGETRYISRDTFEKMFPDYNKNNKVRRTVIMDGEPFDWDMPISVNKDIMQIIATLRGMEKSPLSVKYKTSWAGEGLSKRYTTILFNEGKQTEVAPISIGGEVPVEKVEDKLALSENEKTLIDAIKTEATKRNVSMFTFEQLKDNFIKSGVEEPRAKILYEQYLETK